MEHRRSSSRDCRKMLEATWETEEVVGDAAADAEDAGGEVATALEAGKLGPIGTRAWHPVGADGALHAVCNVRGTGSTLLDSTQLECISITKYYG